MGGPEKQTTSGYACNDLAFDTRNVKDARACARFSLHYILWQYKFYETFRIINSNNVYVNRYDDSMM